MNFLKYTPRIAITAALLVLLAACGGGQQTKTAEPAGRTSPRNEEVAASGSVGTARSPEIASALSKAAALNTETLQSADREASSNPARTAVRKSGSLAKALSGVPVHRFYNTQTAAHFYTISEEERARVAATLPQFQYEGVAFSVAAVAGPSLSPVYRFFNNQTGVHFYSISAQEKAHIEQTLPQFSYEGIAYYASQVSGQGLMPLYRFYQTQKGFHFYSASHVERDSVIDALPVYHFEGVGYYVLADASTQAEPLGPLNDTGSSGAQCYQAGSDALVSCDSAAARVLNHLQDGMIGRDRNAPEGSDGAKGFSYTKISNSGTELPATAALGSGANDWACTRDNVTGLVWEVKTSGGGLRDQNTFFTNYTRADLPQVEDWWSNIPNTSYRNPTAAEINSLTNTVGYRQAVNGLGLCGHSDWRLPTAVELMGLVDYGQPQGSFSVDTAWFPDIATSMWGVNGTAQMWWTSEDMHHVPAEWVGHPWYPSPYIHGWAVDMQNGSVFDLQRAAGNPAVRLVRGLAPSGGRYSYSANGAEVIDNHMRLTWRRCLEGMGWNGSACTGTARVFTHEAALAHARSQTGWRVPNVKELATIQDRAQPRGYNEAVFPNTPTYGKSWTSTPVMKSRSSGEPQQVAGFGVWIVKFKWGGVVHYDSDGRHSSMLRLVRKTP